MQTLTILFSIFQTSPTQTTSQIFSMDPRMMVVITPQRPRDV